MGLYRLMFGKLGYEQIVDPGLERQLRMRHEGRIGELESLGFRYLCCYTESFAAGRLMLLLPVPVVLSGLLGGEIIRLRGGRVRTCVMLLVSGDKTTYASVFGLGVMLYTGFSDGALLVTMNHNVSMPDVRRPPLLKRYRGGSIADAWADHQGAIRSTDFADKHAVREVNFQSFADMVRRQTDLET